MRKVVIKDWPYPNKMKAMLIQIGIPIYDGNGNWHTEVLFRNFNGERRQIDLDWGLLPMLSHGQIFCEGTKVGENSKDKVGKFSFDNAFFEFYIDRFQTEGHIMNRPAFRTNIAGTYYSVPAIEIVRSFFARTKTLAYALLTSNSILPLCQCIVDSNEKRVEVNLSPDCPVELTREKWLPMLAWLSTDELAQRSCNSFFRYFNLCNGVPIYPEQKEDNPIFPLRGNFSLSCRYRSFSSTVWINEITKIDGLKLEFNEIVGMKYVAEGGNGSKGKINVRVVEKPKKIEISNSAQSSLQSHETVEVRLPEFAFENQLQINIIKKKIGIESINSFSDERDIDSSLATGKNEGFIGAVQGIEFSEIDPQIIEDKNIQQSNLIVPGLKEAKIEDIKYNFCLGQYFETINYLSQSPKIFDVQTKIYELPGDNCFTWMLPEVKRCCGISRIRLHSTKVIYIIEIDRSIYGQTRRLSIATLLLELRANNDVGTISKVINTIDESGHWKESKLITLRSQIRYQRVKHVQVEKIKYHLKDKVINFINKF